MGVFRTELRNDDAFINGIGRFDVDVNGSEIVTWSQSEFFFTDFYRENSFFLLNMSEKLLIIIKTLLEN